MTPNRAGMVCFNIAGQVLIVSAMARKDIWVLPKGHIEKDETLDKTAQRECLEECGIIANPLYRIHTSSYTYKGEVVVVEWWAGHALRVAPKDPKDLYNETDWRESRWVSVPEALDMLGFEDLKDAVKAAICSF